MFPLYDLEGRWALWLDKFKTVQIQKNQHRFNVLAYACLKWTSYSHPFGMALMWDHSKYFPNPSSMSIDTLRNQRSSLSQLFGIPKMEHTTTLIIRPAQCHRKSNIEREQQCKQANIAEDGRKKGSLGISIFIFFFPDTTWWSFLIWLFI